MERYHNIIRIEKIKKCLEQGEIGTALMVAQTINKKKIKNLSDLSILAEAYFQNKHYEVAKEIFLSIYSKNKARRILAQLVNLSIKLKDVNDAEKYLEEFKKIAPKDFYCHIFRYNIDKMAGKDIDVLIADLEALKKDAYMESWAYELAKLYHKAGEKDKCIEECGNIFLWFGNGVYVEKAKALKAYYMGEIDLSDIEGKEFELKEEQIASQIEHILSEYELKEKEKEESLEKLKVAEKADTADSYEEDKEIEDISESLIENDAVEEAIVDFEVEASIEYNSEESEVKPSIENNNEENEAAEASIENNSEENEVEIFIENNSEENEVEASIENNSEENEVEISIENNSEENEAEASIENNSEENEVEISIENYSKENYVETSIENLKEEKVIEDTLESSIKGYDKEESTKTSKKVSELEEPLLNKSEIEAMKKSLLKQAKLLEEEKLASMDDEQEHEIEPVLSNDIENHEITVKEDKETKKDIVTEKVNKSEEVKEKKVEEEFYRLLRKEDGVREVHVHNVDLNETKDTVIYKVDSIDLSSFLQVDHDEFSRIIINDEIKIEEILRNYLRVDTVGKQVVGCLKRIVDEGFQDVNFIITGPKSSGKTYLSKCISKILRKINQNVSSKIALIDSSKLNEINLETKKKQLMNCTLIVEHAGSLNAKSISWLLDLYKSHTNCSMIYLEDEKDNMNKLLEKHGELKAIFGHRIELPKYTVEDYVGFAYDYLIEREYEIDVDAYNLLSDKLIKQVHENIEYSLEDVFLLMHEVVKKAENRSAKQLLIQAQKGEFKDSDILVIKKQDVDSV